MQNLSVDVFISSVMSELECDREIASEAISSMNLGSTMFELFPSLSESPAKAYLEKVRHCDIFVLILWKEISSAVYREYSEAAKNSKPILIFIKDLKDGEKRSEKLTDFIAELKKDATTASVYKTYRKLKELESAIKESISEELSTAYAFPKISQTQQELYVLGKEIVDQSCNRLFIYEKTPCVFLGSRDYLKPEDKKIPYEKGYRDSIIEWLARSKDRSHTEFLYLFSIEKTRDELCQYIEYPDYLRRVQERIKRYKDLEVETGFRFRFTPVSLNISGFMIVGDIHYAMWFLGESITLSQKNEKISNAIVDQLKRSHDFSRFKSNTTCDDICRSLGLAT